MAKVTANNPKSDLLPEVEWVSVGTILEVPMKALGVSNGRTNCAEVRVVGMIGPKVAAVIQSCEVESGNDIGSWTATAFSTAHNFVGQVVTLNNCHLRHGW